MKKYLMSAGVFALSPIAHADLVNDSHANLGLRNFYFNNDFRDQAGSLGQSKTEEQAVFGDVVHCLGRQMGAKDGQSA